jgi:hypothetical protein
MYARLEREDGTTIFTVSCRGAESTESAAFVGPGALQRARIYALTVYGIWAEPLDGIEPLPVVQPLVGAGEAAGRHAAVVA